MDKNVKLTIPARKSAEDGILSIIEYVKTREQQNGKSVKEITSSYLFKGSYALATLIKNFYREEVSFVVFDVVNPLTNATVEHACAVLKKRNAEPVYFDINGGKTLDEMRKFVARSAKASVKTVEVKEGFFYAITNVTNAMFSEIVRTGKTTTTTSAIKEVPASTKPALKLISGNELKKRAKSPILKTIEKDTVAKKPTTKVADKKQSAKKPATKLATKKPAAKKTTAKTKKK